jgi:nitroimidazol reductase NimA-like FMN-containing flavoprotein (pyridoxamine 5'-phosphate oxidase superfamily)
MSEERNDDQLQVLPETECIDLLTTTTVGRVAFVDDAGQQLIPLNFTIVDGEIYFRTEQASTLHQLADGHDDVAFEVDHHDEVTPVGWNVTVRGRTARVDDPDLHERVMSSPRLRPWAGGERGVVIHLERRTIAGRRVRRR